MDSQKTARTPKIDRVFRLIRDFKSNLFFKSHGIFYAILFKYGVGIKFQKWQCKIGIYKRYSDGRCMWCGGMHHWEMIRSKKNMKKEGVL